MDDEKNDVDAFLTVTIADPENYPLIKEALSFMLSDKSKIECYSRKHHYLERKPCGMQRSNEWSTQRVVRAHFLCAQQRFAHAGVPAHPGRAVRGRGGDSDAAAAPCAQEHFVFDFGD